MTTFKVVYHAEPRPGSVIPSVGSRDIEAHSWSVEYGALVFYNSNAHSIGAFASGCWTTVSEAPQEEDKSDE